MEHRKLQSSDHCFEDETHLNDSEGTNTFVKDITSTFIRHKRRDNSSQPTGRVSVDRNGRRNVHMGQKSEDNNDLIKLLTLKLLSQLS